MGAFADSNCGPRIRIVFANSQVSVLFLVGHEPLPHLVPRASEAVQAAGGNGSTQLVERQGGAENLIGSGRAKLARKCGRTSPTSDVFGCVRRFSRTRFTICCGVALCC